MELPVKPVHRVHMVDLKNQTARERVEMHQRTNDAVAALAVIAMVVWGVLQLIHWWLR